MSDSTFSKPYLRRDFLRLAGGGLLALPFLSLVGCSRPAAVEGVASASGAKWLTGGTARLASIKQFPNPFGATASSCMLTCQATIGPCHTVSPERVDVSDGWDGLPLRLSLRVVDSHCKPVPDAIVEIWHTNYTGGYSGEIVKMCNNNEADLDKQFFRGYQRSDKDGIVNFNTCYPGWYRGRVVHIHVRVMTGVYDADDRAKASVVTQLVFPDALNQEVFDSVPFYQKHGQPDTTLKTDGIMGGEQDPSPYVLDVERLDDGVMFASKTLVIRASEDEAMCDIKGNFGRGGPDGRRGPPPGFKPGDLPPDFDPAKGMPPRPSQ